MDYRLRKSKGVAVIDLDGRLTIGRGDVALREAVTGLLAGDDRSILVNLDQVSHMDSAGLGEVIACYRRAKAEGGTLKLLNPSSKLNHLFAMTRLHTVIDIFTDERLAIDSFRPGAEPPEAPEPPSPEPEAR